MGGQPLAPPNPILVEGKGESAGVEDARRGFMGTGNVVAMVVLGGALLAPSVAWSRSHIQQAAPNLTSASVFPARVTGGASTSATVTVDVAVPAGGFIVALASGDPAIVGVPRTVSIPAGQTNVSFSVSTSAVTASREVQITATAGSQAKTASLTVVAPPSLRWLTVSPNEAKQGGSVTGRVMLSAPAPAGGLTVSLTSTDQVSVKIPATVSVAQGTVSTTFTLTVGSVPAPKTVTITASTPSGAKTATLALQE